MNDEERLAVVETQYTFIAKKLETIETKLDKYNGIREKLDNVCKEVDDHKSGHWKTATMTIAGGTLAVGLLGLVLHIFKVI